MTDRRIKNMLKSLGPGLLFASAAIGTSHLVLSTRAGAHHGMIFFWIILGTMILKYPFYEFGTRYANATGHSLIKGYKDQGKWAVVIFLIMILLSMFAVTGAIAAVSAGLLSTMFGLSSIPISMLAGGVIVFSVTLLLLGGYPGLDKFIKLISMVLFLSILIAFVAVLIKGSVPKNDHFIEPSLWEGAGLTLLIGLIGWMPSGMEASTMNSIWVVEKMKAEDHHPSLKESLFDFNLGYLFTLLLALMFLIIGAYSVFGTGQMLDGNATQFSNKLLAIFTGHLGQWSYPIIAVTAFGAIYGTLITVLDAFPRCVVRAFRTFKFEEVENNLEQTEFLTKAYKLCLIILGIGGFLLFRFSSASMVQMLELATIFSFLIAPVIGFLNLRAMTSPQIPLSHRPSNAMIILSYLGLIAMVVFAIYYLFTIVST